MAVPWVSGGGCLFGRLEQDDGRNVFFFSLMEKRKNVEVIEDFING